MRETPLSLRHSQLDEYGSKLLVLCAQKTCALRGFHELRRQRVLFHLRLPFVACGKGGEQILPVRDLRRRHAGGTDYTVPERRNAVDALFPPRLHLCEEPAHALRCSDPEHAQPARLDL